jgi:hypothetical protein
MASLTAEQVLCQRTWITLSTTPQFLKDPYFDKFFPDIQAIINTFRKF